jgi:hypothetical protein
MAALQFRFPESELKFNELDFAQQPVENSCAKQPVERGGAAEKWRVDDAGPGCVERGGRREAAPSADTKRLPRDGHMSFARSLFASATSGGMEGWRSTDPAAGVRIRLVAQESWGTNKYVFFRLSFRAPARSARECPDALPEG